MTTDNLFMFELAVLRRMFLYAACVILVAAALAKLFSSSQNVKLLLTQDPVFSALTMKQLLRLVAGLEFVTVGIVILIQNEMAKFLAIAWLSSLFLVYRLSLILVHAPTHYCPCLGTIGESLGIADATMNKISLWTSFILLGGAILSMLTLIKTNSQREAL